MMSNNGEKVLVAPLPPPHSDYVTLLNDDNFNVVGENPEEFWVVKFYQERCFHCKKLQPEYVCGWEEK
jgi:hypothetical protein